LVNFNYDQALGAVVPELEVDGSNTGIVHSFTLTDDAFSGEPFINHKQYYFLAVAYGHNEFMKYSADAAAQVENVSGLTGQKRVYLAGRGNIKVYTGIPHINIGETNPASSYGDGPQIIRLDGQGNGGLSLDLTKETIDEIMSKSPADSANNTFGNSNFPISYQPKYKNNKGPLTIKVIDPLNVKDANYVLRFDSLYKEKINKVSGELGIFAGGDTATKYNSSWTLIDNSTGTEYHSDQSVIANNEQLFLDLGFSVVLNQAYYPGTYMIGYKSTGQLILLKYSVHCRIITAIWNLQLHMRIVPENGCPVFMIRMSLTLITGLEQDLLLTLQILLMMTGMFIIQEVQDRQLL